MKKHATNNKTMNGSQSVNGNFFSSGIRQKVDQLMNILYAGGVNKLAAHQSGSFA